MLKTMRWYGPNDGVSLKEIKECGVEGIVTALHQVPVGETWTVEAIRERQEIIREHGLEWSVVESLPVHEDIKKNAGKAEMYIENYKTSIINLASCGIKVITYNFMPVLDWVRTDHNYVNADGTKALAFSKKAFIYFDIELLNRPNAESDYTPAEVEEAKAYGKELSEEESKLLFKQTLMGLPGSTKDFTADEVLALLQNYEGIDASKLRQNLINFLLEVVPVAEKIGAKLAIHPDDPPFPLLGLPRIMSTHPDANKIFKAVPSLANGLCYCTGSFGAHPENNLLKIIDDFEERIHFLHLRNVIKNSNGDFRESPHLKGDNPMVAIVEKLVAVCDKQSVRLPVRPDHGFLHTLELDRKHYPGYSLIGRLKGLAELAGLEEALLTKRK